ncbi:MAG: TRAP transporter small permease [Myxococcota bacterium]
MSESIYKRIDHAVYRAERALVVVSLVVMAVVVFLDVVHRSFSGEESKFAVAVVTMARWVGVQVAEESAGYERLTAAAPYVLSVIFIGLAYFGIRSAKRATPISPAVALVGAIGGVVVAYGLVQLMVVVLPNGLIWSQNLALVLTLWVGFVGASMCTYENRHLKVEAAQRLLPESWRPIVGFLGGLLTTAVCVVLLWLSVRYVRFNYQEYVATDGKGALILGMDLPKYQGFAALPVAFGLMAIRFLVKALGALRGEVDDPVGPVEAAGGVPTPDPEKRRMPSEVATEALPSVPKESAHESAIDTMTSDSQMVREQEAPQPQSKVPTDAHEVLPGMGAAMVWNPEDELGDDGDEDDPYRTRELDEGPIHLLDETNEIPKVVLGSDTGSEGAR